MLLNVEMVGWVGYNFYERLRNPEKAYFPSCAVFVCVGLKFNKCVARVFEANFSEKSAHRDSVLSIASVSKFSARKKYDLKMNLS